MSKYEELEKKTAEAYNEFKKQSEKFEQARKKYIEIRSKLTEYQMSQIINKQQAIKMAFVN